MTAFDRMIDLLPGAKDTSGDFRDGRAGAGGGNRHGLLLLRSLRLLEATPQPVTPPQKASSAPAKALPKPSAKLAPKAGVKPTLRPKPLPPGGRR